VETIPLALSLAFILLTGLASWLFCQATPRALPTCYVLLAWLALQAGLSLQGFYSAGPATRPPLMLLAVLPPLLVKGGLLLTTQGRCYLKNLRLDRLTLLHTIRLPVELGLLVLHRYHVVPQLMTFEGRNWDILAGLSAPVLYYLVFRRKLLGYKALLGWNILCLGLLLNILFQAILSVPGPLQQFAFEQPNIAVLYFPFIWLPSCLVPLVLLAHTAAFYQLSQARVAQPLLNERGAYHIT
jgi:hypothetical protein